MNGSARKHALLYRFGVYLLAIGCLLSASREALAGPHDHDAMEREAHAKFHERRAVRLFRERRFDGAASEFSAMIELKPNAAAPVSLRANAHFRTVPSSWLWPIMVKHSDFIPASPLLAPPGEHADRAWEAGRGCGRIQRCARAGA